MLVGSATGALMLGSLAVSVFAVGTNGSFESGIVPGVFTTLAAGDSTSITDWTVTSGTIDYIGSYWTASDGVRSIDMSGNAAGAISQTFPTTTGAVYNVTFDMAGNPAGGPTVKHMEVDAGGAPTLYTFDTTGMTLANMGWTPETFTFTATSANTTLRFTSLDHTAYGPALDNVVVEQYLPTTKDDCKKDGWKDFGVFKNQGDCVSFVATGGKNLPANQ